MVRARASSPTTRVAALAVLTWTFLLASANAQNRKEPESFYTTLSNSRIVQVESVDGGVKIRVIEIDYNEQACGWNKVVRARDAVLPGLDVATVAGTPVCSSSQRRVDRALERSREDFIRTRYSIPTGVNINTVVASCDGRERRVVFDSHAQPGIDGAALKRFDRRVYDLWTLGDRVLTQASVSVPDTATQKALGTVVAADLVGGKYDGAYSDMCWDQRGNRASCSPRFWAQILGVYTGPDMLPAPLPVELVDQSSWQFVRYVPPEFPPIALSARLYRDVRLRLEVERSSGAVTQATVVEGNPILNHAALTAAWQWRFVPGTHPLDPFEVTLRFELRCPSQ